MRICFDLDNTIFSTDGMDYEHSRPIERMVELVNMLFDSGHEITIFTARGSGSGIDFSELTENQLHRAGLKYHTILFKKPPYDVALDDRSVRFRGQSSAEILEEMEDITGQKIARPDNI